MLKEIHHRYLEVSKNVFNYYYNTFILNHITFQIMYKIHEMKNQILTYLLLYYCIVQWRSVGWG